MQLLELVNSDFGLVLMSFLLTTVAGGAITIIFQREAWRRQTRVNLYQKLYEDGVAFLDDLSDQIGERFYNLQRLLWAIEDPQRYDLQEMEKRYFESVHRWNVKLRSNRNKTRLLIGEDAARKFLDYRDDSRSDSPLSIHYQFVLATKQVIASKTDKQNTRSAQSYVDQVNHSCSNYLETITTVFLNRARDLQLLNIEPTVGEQSEQ